MIKSYERVVSYRHGKRKTLKNKDLDIVIHLAEMFIELHDKLDYYTEAE